MPPKKKPPSAEAPVGPVQDGNQQLINLARERRHLIHQSAAHAEAKKKETEDMLAVRQPVYNAPPNAQALYEAAVEERQRLQREMQERKASGQKPRDSKGRIIKEPPLPPEPVQPAYSMGLGRKKRGKGMHNQRGGRIFPVPVGPFPMEDRPKFTLMPVERPTLMGMGKKRGSAKGRGRAAGYTMDGSPIKFRQAGRGDGIMREEWDNMPRAVDSDMFMPLPPRLPSRPFMPRPYMPGPVRNTGPYKLL